MTDQNDLVFLTREALLFLVNLFDQGTRCIDHAQIAPTRHLLNTLGDAVGAENGNGAFRDFVDLLDEPHTLAFQGFNDPLVVNDLIPSGSRGC